MQHSVRSWALSLIVPLFAFVSCAAPQPVASQPLRDAVGAYELEVLVNGVPARTFAYEGGTYVLGQQGSRYVLRVYNRSGRRIEAVLSVDGLDVIDGKPGDFANKRGYLVEAYDHVDIDGWRLSNREAAAFRFAPIAESYAAKTGHARNVGVIGVAVFPERSRPQPEPSYVPRTYYRSEPDALLDGVGAHKSAASASAPAPRANLQSGASPRKAEAADDTLGSLEALGEAPRSSARAERRSRSGLGTEFGEAVDSQIHEVEFVRANATHPAALLGARYNDRTGLLALGIDVDGCKPNDLALRQSADPFPVSRRFARPPADWRRD